MKRLNSVFYSLLIDKEVKNSSGIIIGKFKDAFFIPEDDNPSVPAFSVLYNNREYIYEWVSVDISESEKGRISITAGSTSEYTLKGNELSLNGKLLDKQIVDINGRKVVRVNDVRLAEINGCMKIIAVDIGFPGLLRRLGIENQSRNIASIFKISMFDNLISWSDVQPIETEGESDRIKLAVPFNKLKKLHPADLADIIEELDVKERNAIFQSLDDETAANTLEEIDPKVQVSIIGGLSDERAADILETMDADEAADILEELPEHEAENLLNHMETEESQEIKELMDYEENTVGSIMTTEHVSFSPTITVDETINMLRRMKPSPDMVYYIYVTDRRGRLIGVVSLRDLVISMPDTRLGEIMQTNLISIKDTDNFDNLQELMTKYSLLALPVVNDENVLLGMAILNDIVDEILLPNKKRA